MRSVELIFDATCPNVGAARAALREALGPFGWIEWDRADPNAPPYAQTYASPTILVGGRDVGGATALDAGSGCRVYAGARGTFAGAPTVEMILEALRDA
jgi:hypothetical protein